VLLAERAWIGGNYALTAADGAFEMRRVADVLNASIHDSSSLDPRGNMGRGRAVCLFMDSFRRRHATSFMLWCHVSGTGLEAIPPAKRRYYPLSKSLSGSPKGLNRSGATIV
jgi:hypothetical protein